MAPVVKHFEACLYASFWSGAAALAWIAGRPALALIGLVTVLPVLVLYAIRARHS